MRDYQVDEVSNDFSKGSDRLSVWVTLLSATAFTVTVICQSICLVQNYKHDIACIHATLGVKAIKTDKRITYRLIVVAQERMR